MTSPADDIAALERDLLLSGQDVIVRRYTAATGSPRPKMDIGVRAFVRPIKAEHLGGNVTQTVSNVYLSASGLAELLPLRKDDKIVIAGRERNVEVVKPIEKAGVLVRINLVVLG